MANVSITDVADINYAITDTDVLPLTSADGLTLKGVTRDQILTAGESNYTVGKAGKYKTLQAAIIAVFARPAQFTYYLGDPLYQDTCTFTQGSRVVTSGANNYFVYNGDRQNYITAEDPTLGNDVKWYPIAARSSETEIILDVEFMEATVTRPINQWATGEPIMAFVKVLDALDEIAVLSPDGVQPAVNVPTVAIDIDYGTNNLNGALFICVQSGVVSVRNIHIQQGQGWSLSGNPNDSVNTNVTDVYLDNVNTRSQIGNDFIWLQTGDAGCGRMYVKNSHMYGVFDVFLPQVRGRLEVYNCTFEHREQGAVAQTSGTKNTSGLHALFAAEDRKYIVVRFYRCNIIMHAYGYTAVGQPTVLSIGHDSNTFGSMYHDIAFDDCSVVMDVDYFGGTIGATLALLYIAVEDSDVVFRRCMFGISGNPVIPVGWNFIKFSSTVAAYAVPARVKFIDCILPKELSSDLETKRIITITEITNSAQQSLTISLPIDPAEFSMLRANAFVTPALSAAIAIPAILNSTEGNEIEFSFTENATAGNAVTWHASFKFVAPWVDSVATTDANKVTTIKFKKVGVSWYQTSPANVWL